MKLLLVTLLCATGLAATSQAQVLSDRAARNMLLGGIAGAIIGENNDHRAAQGALIGATAGLAWTALTEDGDGRRHVSYSSPSSCRETVVVRSAPRCEPERTVVVVKPRRDYCETPTRVVVVNPRREERTIVVRGNDCDRQQVVIVDGHRGHRSDRVVVLDREDRRERRGNRVIVYEEGRRPRYDYND